MFDAEQRTAAWRPAYVSAAVFAMFFVAGRFFLAPDPDFATSPHFAELGGWLVALGAGQVLVVLSLLALFHRESGLMYCERGIPGITTFSAGGVLAVSLLVIAFGGLSLGASLALSGEASRDLVAAGLWALGGWLATIVFVPLRRRLKKRRPPANGRQ